MSSLEQRVRELERANSHLSYALATKNLEVQHLAAELNQLKSKDANTSREHELQSIGEGPAIAYLPACAKSQNRVTESAALTAGTPCCSLHLVS